jgi:hypothetical protein
LPEVQKKVIAMSNHPVPESAESEDLLIFPDWFNSLGIAILLVSAALVAVCVVLLANVPA